jgi:catechol 2,3-dioxygenase-like lactoylglutathione lyase family enzyme
MAELKVQGVVHWSIPVNNLEEAEKFYGELLGLEPKGRLGGSGMSCFRARRSQHFALRPQRYNGPNTGTRQPASSRVHGQSGNVGERMSGVSQKWREDR